MHCVVSDEAGDEPTSRGRAALSRRGGSSGGCRCGERGEAPLSLAEIVAAGKIEYIDFPAALVGKYQCFTEADLGRLRGVGCDHAFAAVAEGVERYAAALRART